MTALAIERMRKVETWKRKRFTLTGGKAFKGAIALLDKSTGKVVKGQSSAAGYVRIGVFAETVDATSADALVDVDLEREIAEQIRAAVVTEREMRHALHHLGRKRGGGGSAAGRSMR